MRQQILGKTGLTQKDAIFEIIKNALGNEYNPNVPVKNALYVTTPTYEGVTKNLNSTFRKISKQVYEGLVDGSIPSKITTEYKRKEYSTRIIHYWLKNDPRLNGGSSAHEKKKKLKDFHKLLQPSLLRQRHIQLKFANDPQLSSLEELLSQTNLEIDRFELSYNLYKRSIELILETFEINSPALVEEISKVLKKDHVTKKIYTSTESKIEILEQEYKIYQALKAEKYTNEEIEFIIYGGTEPVRKIKTA